ncbi:hypothetical protein WA026_013369 [Henosepilachna vigintioctopunctata]|uniref:Uncharacterized protein n=1 Tax=Henosepilachna vigintioctopunctata TaxID=420089 RepID=A0AAW1V5S0_9CUCU
MEVVLAKFMPSRTISLCSKLRTPLIKFRYGLSRDHKPPAVSTAAANPKNTNVESGEAIYDFQIPARWRRKPLSEEECDYINRGGPDKL